MSRYPLFVRSCLLGVFWLCCSYAKADVLSRTLFDGETAEVYYAAADCGGDETAAHHVATHVLDGLDDAYQKYCGWGFSKPPFPSPPLSFCYLLGGAYAAYLDNSAPEGQFRYELEPCLLRPTIRVNPVAGVDSGYGLDQDYTLFVHSEHRLKSTAAHELFHWVQANYEWNVVNQYSLLCEPTATFMVSLVMPEIELRSSPPPGTPSPSNYTQYANQFLKGGTSYYYEWCLFWRFVYERNYASNSTATQRLGVLRRALAKAQTLGAPSSGQAWARSIEAVSYALDQEQQYYSSFREAMRGMAIVNYLTGSEISLSPSLATQRPDLSPYEHPDVYLPPRVYNDSNGDGLTDWLADNLTLQPVGETWEGSPYGIRPCYAVIAMDWEHTKNPSGSILFGKQSEESFDSTDPNRFDLQALIISDSELVAIDEVDVDSGIGVYLLPNTLHDGDTYRKVDRVVIVVTRYDGEMVEAGFNLALLNSPESVPPQIRPDTVMPVPGTTVPEDTEIGVAFTEAIQLGTLTPQVSVFLAGSVSQHHVFEAQYHPDSRSVSIHNMSPRFEPGETVTVTLTTGVLDTAHNGLDGDGDGSPGPDYEWSFVVAGDSVSDLAATMTATPNPAHVGENVVFQVSASGGSGSYILYEWDFDADNQWDYTSYGIDTAVYVYGAPGCYLARCHVTDSALRTVSAFLSIDVGSLCSEDPVIFNVAHFPSVVLSHTAPHVYANITSCIAITAASARWATVPTGPFVQSQLMQDQGGHLYRTASPLPDQDIGTTVYYYVEAWDSESHYTKSPLRSYRVIRSVDDDDHDGYIDKGSGGDDCNDWDASVHPDAPEIPYNGRDDDCDGCKDEMCPFLNKWELYQRWEDSDDCIGIAGDDLDGDGQAEVVAMFDYAGAKAYRADGTLMWEHDFDRQFIRAQIFISDINLDGQKEIVIAASYSSYAAPSYGYVYVLSASGGLRNQFSESGDTLHAGVGDMDGDGTKEIAVGYAEGIDYDRVAVVKMLAANCSTLCEYRIDYGWDPAHYRHIFSDVDALAVADSDGNGRTEVFASVYADSLCPLN